MLIACYISYFVFKYSCYYWSFCLHGCGQEFIVLVYILNYLVVFNSYWLGFQM